MNTAEQLAALLAEQAELQKVDAPPLQPAPTLETAKGLRSMKFDPVKYVVRNYLAEGCTIIAGKPKIGKSWFALDSGIAVASGGDCFGVKCESGNVLYLALEDNRRRLRSRIEKILGPDVEWPERFEFATEWLRAEEGGLAQIRAWIKSVPNPRLIVVDVLAAFRSARGQSQGVYDCDYLGVKALQQIASETPGLAVLIVHHLRKGGSEGDPMDKISGTLGLSGAADSVLIIDRDGDGCTLYGRGRDIEEIETAVEFERATCRWKPIGDAADIRMSGQRGKIIDALRTHGALGPADISAATSIDYNGTKQFLFKMVKDGQIRKLERGKYGVVADVPMPQLPVR